jgi:hypothetical protein
MLAVCVPVDESSKPRSQRTAALSRSCKCSAYWRWALRTRLGWARTLLARGQIARAQALIATARGSANELGMAPAQVSAERLRASAERCA